MESMGLCVNPGKNEIVQSEYGNYSCHAVKTRLITNEDSLADIVSEYAKPYLQKGDILFMSEKMVACIQGRAIEISSVKPGFLAKFLYRFVSRNQAGANLRLPETMQCAINECGAFRILLASVAGMFGKLFRKKGWFYKIAGYRVAGIDAPCAHTIPPYDKYIVLTPLNLDATVKNISKILDGVVVLVVDVNDLGVNILESSEKIDNGRIASLLRQNPLGQSAQSTPMGILRPLTQELEEVINLI